MALSCRAERRYWPFQVRSSLTYFRSTSPSSLWTPHLPVRYSRKPGGSTGRPARFQRVGSRAAEKARAVCARPYYQSRGIFGGYLTVASVAWPLIARGSLLKLRGRCALSCARVAGIANASGAKRHGPGPQARARMSRHPNVAQQCRAHAALRAKSLRSFNRSSGKRSRRPCFVQVRRCSGRCRPWI